jgi:hypothetical protein
MDGSPSAIDKEYAALHAAATDRPRSVAPRRAVGGFGSHQGHWSVTCCDERARRLPNPDFGNSGLCARVQSVAQRPKTQSLERTTTANAKFIACRIWPTLGMAAAPMSQNTATGRLAVVVTDPPQPNAQVKLISEPGLVAHAGSSGSGGARYRLLPSCWRHCHGPADVFTNAWS